MRFYVLPLLAGLAVLAAPAEAVQAPQVSIHAIADLPTPLPYPYDEKADAHAAVDATFTRAKASHKRVFIDLGGNWCGDCRVLAGIMDLPEIKAFIERHYEVVTVDVGRYNRNMDIPERFGAGHLAGGVPTVIIADADGKTVNASNAAELEDARHMTPQAIADWLARWAKD